MILVQYERLFLKAAKKLPSKIQQQLAMTIETLRENPFHPMDVSHRKDAYR